MRGLVKVLLSSACGCWLAACSTSQYNDALTALNKGLSSSQASLTSLDARYKLSLVLVSASDTAKLTIDNCAPPFPPRARVAPKNIRCTLSADGKPSKSWDTSKIPNGLLAMQALVDYGQGLGKLVAADDVAKVNSGLKTIDGAIAGAAKAAGAAAPATKSYLRRLPGPPRSRRPIRHAPGRRPGRGKIARAGFAALAPFFPLPARTGWTCPRTLRARDT